jgi:hypothetical protein
VCWRGREHGLVVGSVMNRRGLHQNEAARTVPLREGEYPDSMRSLNRGSAQTSLALLPDGYRITRPEGSIDSEVAGCRSREFPNRANATAKNANTPTSVLGQPDLRLTGSSGLSRGFGPG